jgi:actin-related protein 10
MTDPKARKVLVVENPLLPLRVKELIARVLFENIQVSPKRKAQYEHF